MFRRSYTSSSRRSSSRLRAGIGFALALLCICAASACILTGNDPLDLLFTPTPQTVPTTFLEGIPASRATLANTSSWWEVYFTDPLTINNPDDLRGSIPEKLVARINTAQISIDIAAYEFNLTPVAEALIQAKGRGVTIRWVTDDENGLGADTEEGHGQFAMLRMAGIKIKDDHQQGLMHNKFIVFDQAVVWTGSTNLTSSDNFRNNNNVIIIRSADLAEIYTRQFNEMWSGKFGSDSPSNLSQQQVTIQGTPIQVLFSPEDKPMNTLIPYILKAKKSIYFLAFSFTHDGLTQSLLDQDKAGITVEGVFETRGSQDEYSALTPLYCAGLDVRQDGNPANLHHKVIIIDEKIVVTGSLNFSNNGNRTNNENTLIITNPQIAAIYLQEFQRRYAEASPPPKADISCK
jgi:phosphatidylserine/phosphatidylglycerophosphate/cardiolipin synthase-like enzyme